MAKVGEDCYYYYYSTCNKGAMCKYRHCEAAKGSEIVCPNWERRGQCPKVNCEYRHAVIEKCRSSIECYWENQPGGCQKPHCVFKHLKPRPKFTGVSAEHSTVKDKVKVEGGIPKMDEPGAAGIGAAGGVKVEKPLIGLEKRKLELSGKPEDSCVSDSEISNKKRKRTAISDLFREDKDKTASGGIMEKSVQLHSDKPAPTSTTGPKKICLRKPTVRSPDTVSSSNDAGAKEQLSQQEPQAKKQRVWRRKSASPKLQTGATEPTPQSETPPTTPAIVEIPKSTPIVNKIDSTAGKKQEEPPEDDVDDEYRSKLIDIFGEDLAEMYIRQGIKLDLSHYPSK